MSDDRMIERRAGGDGISVKLDLLHADVGDMKEAIKTLATAINRLAVVEERLGNTGQALERAFIALEKVEARCSAAEGRLSELEKINVTTIHNNGWIDKAVWAALGLLAMYAAKKMGMV